jgi:hypothetical protein
MGIWQYKNMNEFDKCRCQKLINTILKPVLIGSANGSLIPFPVDTENGKELLFVLKGDYSIVKDFINEKETDPVSAVFFHYYEPVPYRPSIKNYIFRIEFDFLKPNHLFAESIFNNALQKEGLPILKKQKHLHLMVVLFKSNGEHEFIKMKRFNFDYNLMGTPKNI